MEDRYNLLNTYIRANVAPILVDFISSKDINGATVLPANIDIKELNGYYENTNYMPPKWYSNMNNENKIIVIDRIDTISKDEQLKFVELLKYRKVSTFELTNDCVIIITTNKISKDVINEKVFSLVATIRG